jgi:NodT family efflux transporter outer membrane factor (OMF) lipoprotein
MKPVTLLKIATVAMVLAILPACTVGPDYVKPKTDAPPAYKENENWKVAQPKDEANRGAWWEMFNDPQLNALEDQVNVSNQNLAVAEAQFRQARSLVQAARAGYFPTVSGGVSASRSQRSSNVGTGPVSSTGAISDFLLSGDVSWELDIWGKVRRSVEGSKANAQASAGDLESTRLSIQAELAQDYFQMRTLDAQKQLLDRTATAYQSFLDLTRNRYASGVASRSDILQAETQLKNTQALAIDTGVQRAQLEHAIALLIGKAPSELTISTEPLSAQPPAVPAGVPSDLLERRPDIAAAERRAAAANAQIGVVQAAYYPTITLSASGGFETSHITNWLTWPSRFWTLGPALLQQTIVDGGLRRAQTDQARAAYDANVATYRQTVLTGFQEVEDNLASLRILEQEDQVQSEAVRAARQSVEVTSNRYKAGIATALDVIVVQAIALNSETTAVNLLGRRMTACVLLIKALGGDWKASELPSGDAVATR